MLITDYFRRNAWGLFTLLGGMAAAGVYWLCSGSLSERPTGGSTLGLWYGVGGSLCLVAVGVMLPLQRRRRALGRVGRRRSWWLKGHVWLSLLGGVLILGHCGGRFGGRLETVLMVVFALTLLTGLIGLGFQYWLPRRMTRSCPNEIPIGQIAQVCQILGQQSDTLLDKMGAKLAPPAAQELRRRYDQHVRPFLDPKLPWRRPLVRPSAQAEDVLEEWRNQPDMQALGEDLKSLQRICQTRRELGQQQWLQAWLHGWLLLHVALSVALLVLGAVHAVMSLYY